MCVSVGVHLQMHIHRVQLLEYIMCIASGIDSTYFVRTYYSGVGKCKHISWYKQCMCSYMKYVN